MSAFVVDSATINRILAFVRYDRNGEWARHKLAEAGYPLNGAPSLARLGSAMYDLNVAAVEDRYPDCIGHPENRPGNTEEAISGYRFEGTYPPSPIAAVKALDCWLYQCAEGDVPTRPLYQLFDMIRHMLTSRIVGSLPEYEAAPWG